MQVNAILTIYIYQLQFLGEKQNPRGYLWFNFCNRNKIIWFWIDFIVFARSEENLVFHSKFRKKCLNSKSRWRNKVWKNFHTNKQNMLHKASNETAANRDYSLARFRIGSNAKSCATKNYSRTRNASKHFGRIDIARSYANINLTITNFELALLLFRERTIRLIKMYNVN